MLLSRFSCRLALTLLLVATAVAHGQNTAHTAHDGTNVNPSSLKSYFREQTASGLLNGHITLLSVSWIGAFPLCKKAPSSQIFTRLFC
jgi:hypothetical protein